MNTRLTVEHSHVLTLYLLLFRTVALGGRPPRVRLSTLALALLSLLSYRARIRHAPRIQQTWPNQH